MLCLCALAGCAAAELLEGKRARAVRLATEAGWRTLELEAGRFTLTAFHKGFEGRPAELVVYIESDGDAWRNRFQLAADPTPANPLALRLALADPAPSVLYLGRPCQYTRPATAQNCHPAYWAGQRYAEAVINSIDVAIDQVKRVAAARAVVLVGYSGGGAVAALVAARRDDVARLITVAANLDHAAWTAHHRLAPLSGSLNPADHAERLQSLPQVHFAGAKDRVVPPHIVEAYLERMGEGAGARLVVVEGADHDCCWVEAWPDLLRRHRP
ncbi:MAG: alpha/beta hydrolase [Alphaproteobacteria bacterium]|nr:alpha/beta hydrolase [Alphaproteobacteria bacterium]